MRSIILTTKKIRAFSKYKKNNLRKELTDLYNQAFPMMPVKERCLYINDYFIDPGRYFNRTAIFFKNTTETLISAAIFDERIFSHQKEKISGIYSISRAVNPIYQSLGLGKKIAASIFKENAPFVLFTTCAQSASLHSWRNLWKKGIIKNYDFYPQFIKIGEKTTVNAIPENGLSTISRMFKKIYGGVAKGDQKLITSAAQSLTPTMVRKNMYSSHYRFHPWKKNGREDELANALGVTPYDGILLFFKKKKVALWE